MQQLPSKFSDYSACLRQIFSQCNSRVADDGQGSGRSGGRGVRPLDEKERTAVFEKLFKIFGPNLKHMVDHPPPWCYCFRLYKNCVYYGSEGIVRRTTSVACGRLVSLATCIGKFTKGGSFCLTGQALVLLAAHARRKVCVIETSEKSLTSGAHVLKVDLSRISENVAAGEGVIVFSSSNVHLAFGIVAKSAQDF